ncbi:MAG: prolyl oligopeptidase family serine peptidase, partial [Thermomicrobiales bacterium]
AFRRRELTTPPRFDANIVLKQAMIQDLTISPDGTTVVFSRRVIASNQYQSALWAAPFDGGIPVQLTSDGFNDRHPRFSPDGSSLFFTSDRSGKTRLWIHYFEEGSQRQLFDFDGEIGDSEWSPNGDSIAFTAPSGVDRFIVGDRDDPIARRITDLTWRWDGAGVRDMFSSVYILNIESGAAQRVTDPTYDASRPVWSPDGNRIGFIADLREAAALGQAPQFWSTDRAGTEAPRQHTSFGGFAIAGAWSSEGTLAVVGMNETPGAEWANFNLYVSSDAGVQQLATSLDRPLGNASFGDLVDPDASLTITWQNERQLVALVSDRGAALPYRFNVGTPGEYERLADGEFTCSSVAVSGDRVAVVATDRGRPGEVYAVESGSLRQLTTNGGDWLDNQVNPERFTVSHPDGITFETWLVRGREAEGPAPTVIQVHGGPHLAHGPTPWLEMLALADAGINVLYPNPRGSMGYGEDFSFPVHTAYGEADGDDMLRLVEWAIEEGIAQPEHIGIFGLSYGGFMTLWMMGKHPGMFSAGISENPLANAIGSYGANDIADWAIEQFGHLPEAMPEYLKRSPFMTIHHNKSPLLLLQSDNDLRCPPLNTEIVFTILRTRGVTTEMIRYPDEPHYLAGIGRPDRRIDRINRHVDWFTKYL